MVKDHGSQPPAPLPPKSVHHQIHNMSYKPTEQDTQKKIAIMSQTQLVSQVQKHGSNLQNCSHTILGKTLVSLMMYDWQVFHAAHTTLCIYEYYLDIMPEFPAIPASFWVQFLGKFWTKIYK